jgi:hypothetical protein
MSWPDIEDATEEDPEDGIVYENLISQPTVTNDFLFQILFISAGLSLKEPLSREAQPSISSSKFCL